MRELPKNSDIKVNYTALYDIYDTYADILKQYTYNLVESSISYGRPRTITVAASKWKK